MIFSSQKKDFLGLEMVSHIRIYYNGKHIFLYGHNHYGSLLIGLLTILIIVFWPKLGLKVPGPLIEIIVTTLMVNFII
jgi:SulP family sulfate permease